MSDFSSLKQHAFALYDLLQTSEDPEVKSHLRKLIYQLDMMDEASLIVPESARTLAAWLLRMCDVEHGLLVKRYPDDPNEMDGVSIDQHVKLQQEQLHAGMTLESNVLRGVKHLAGMLGVSGVNTVPVADQMAWFANVLLEHLRQDQDMGKQLHQLALATMDSLRAIQEMLAEIGEQSPELQHVAMMLSTPIPTDPVQARNYLQQVNDNLQHVQRKMIEGSKRMQHDIDDRVQDFEGVSNQLSATHKEVRSDTLTGLPNRRALIDFLDDHPALTTISLVILDIDQLQKVNDLTGEAGGDRCLCELADLLIGRVRAEDMVFRVGGDEFVVVFPGIGSEAAMKAVQGLHESVDHMPELYLSGHKIKIRVSLGLAERAGNEALHAWIKRADAALYVAKGKGGHCLEASP